MEYRFEWDKNKAESNLKKHGVSFHEAYTVFFDDLARIFDDTEHSHGETRELIFGYSNKKRLLIVSFTQRGDIIRIISARNVTKSERKRYEEYKN